MDKDTDVRGTTSVFHSIHTDDVKLEAIVSLAHMNISKGVLATVCDVQKAVLILVIFIDVRHQGRCRKDRNRLVLGSTIDRGTTF